MALRPLHVAALLCASFGAADAETIITPTAPVKLAAPAPYVWGDAVMGGVEYATGVLVNPKHPELLYTRCDTGGFFQLDRAHDRWVAKMNTIPWKWSQLFSVESLALDANDPNVFYADTGGGRWGNLDDVLKTTDGGKHWARTHLTRPDGKWSTATRRATTSPPGSGWPATRTTAARSGSARAPTACSTARTARKLGIR